MNAETKTQTPPDPTTTVVAFWQQWMEQSSRGTQALLEAVQSASDPGVVQKRWMDAVSESLEGFLRTPAFLEMMKRNLKAMTDLKTMQDQIIEGTAGQLGLPLAKDITGLFERLSSMNHAILDRLTAIEARLDSLDPNAKKTGASGGKRRPTGARPPADRGKCLNRRSDPGVPWGLCPAVVRVRRPGSRPRSPNPGRPRTGSGRHPCPRLSRRVGAGSGRGRRNHPGRSRLPPGRPRRDPPRRRRRKS